MKTFNHMYTIAFSLESHKEDGSDVTADMLAAAIMRRVADCITPSPFMRKSDALEILEACGGPDDTYEVEPAKEGQ